MIWTPPKQTLLDLAEILDAFRVFPRGLLAVYVVYLWDVHAGVAQGQVDEWYAVIVWGGMAAITKFYVDSGRKW